MNKSKILTVMLIVAAVFAAAAVAEAFNIIGIGSADTDNIRKIQTRLKSWGYYTGTVDGRYGAKTEAAVKYFQKTNGLKVDGKVGEQTMKAIGLPTGSSSSNSGNSGSSGNAAGEVDVMMLARCVNGEARGEPYNGQVAVAAVILNRVDDPGFPNSISGVIYQSGAFDAVKDGQINLRPSDSSIRAARDAMAGVDPSGGAIYYYNPVTATNKWIRSREIIATIGNHVFCK